MKFILFLVTLILAFPLRGYPATVLVLGDSLSAAYGIDQEKGWVNLLRQKLFLIDDEHRVINASISGETAAGGVSRIARLLDAHSPHILILALGGNDGLRARNPKQIEQNLELIINAAQNINTQILLVRMRLPPNYGPAYISSFELIFSRLAEQHNIPLTPFLLKNVAEYDELMQADRLHPTSTAQPIMLENIFPELLKLVSTFQ